MNTPDRIDVRRTSPGLYRLSMAVVSAQLFAFFNLWLSKPAFIPFDIPLAPIALAFLTLSLAQFLVLHVPPLRRLWAWRVVQAVSMGAMMFWGVANTQQFFQGPASLQLPGWITFAGVVQLLLLIESPPLVEEQA